MRYLLTAATGMYDDDELFNSNDLLGVFDSVKQAEDAIKKHCFRLYLSEEGIEDEYYETDELGLEILADYMKLSKNDNELDKDFKKRVKKAVEKYISARVRTQLNMKEKNINKLDFIKENHFGRRYARFSYWTDFETNTTYEVEFMLIELD